MAFQGEMPTAPLVIGAVVTAPVWIPALAVFGAYHGIKAVFTHGIIPGVEKIAAASKKA